MTDLDTRPPSRPRSRKRAVLATVAVLVVVGVAIGLALFQPWRLVTRSTVDEALPVAAQSQVMTSAPAAATQVASAEAAAPAEPEPAAVPAEAPPLASAPTGPVVLAAGTFVDGEHPTSGTASVLQLPDGSRFVRLEGFSTSDGPDVHVWITDQEAGGDFGKYDDGRYLELGDLKGTDGNQNYAIPADADVTGLTSVVIWCDRFNVAFGTAAVSL